jgi:amino-acid N-acetyltransferase
VDARVDAAVPVEVRLAREQDTKNISKLLEYYGKKELLLPRSEEDVRNYLKNFLVAERDGRFLGCVAVRDFGNALFEIRSLAVHESEEGRGIGSFLIRDAIRRRAVPGARIFALTHRPRLFLNLGFCEVDKAVFPEKIWSDCSLCSKRDHCDEVAVLYQPE